MASELKPGNIYHSFKTLKGNTRISVLFEPFWGVPYALYSFYLSLYMKSQGVTNQQLGFLISLGFIASIVFSMFGGIITDMLGRKRTTLIFDLISWPLAIFIYIISNNFWMFALAQLVNSMNKITAVSWNLMLVEDAESHQQVDAYNLINTINLSLGILTPLAGIIIRELGIVNGERILLAFMVVSMTVMIFWRNRYYRETTVGQEILRENNDSRQGGRKLTLGFLRVLRQKPQVLMVLGLSILFNAYIPIGTNQSLYYGPFLTEVLKLDKSAIAVLGGISAAIMLLAFVFLVPLCAKFSRLSMAAGLLIQVLSLLLFVTIPPGNFLSAIVCVILFALGFGMSKPFMDAILAEVSGGKDRAAIYAFYNTAVAACCAAVGFGSGFLYKLSPATIYWLSIGILTVCIGCVAWLEITRMRTDKEQARIKSSPTAG